MRRGMVADAFEGKRVVSLDLETTGISTKSDRIVQIALIGAHHDGRAINFDEVVNPGRPIPVEAARIHGLYDEDVKDAGKFSVVADEVAKMIEGAVLVGHNVRRFDIPLLENEFLRIGMNPPQPMAVLDTLECVRRLKIPRPHNLGAQCARHGISLENAHTAGADAAASLLLLWRVIQDHPASFRKSVEEIERWLRHGDLKQDASEIGRGLNDLEPVDRGGRIRRDGCDLVLAFGRHRGRTVKEVASMDSGYINWLLSPNGIDDADAREVIKNHLEE